MAPLIIKVCELGFVGFAPISDFGDILGVS